jgi:hypothetical protein
MEFGQAYYRYLLKTILRKFILYFSDFYTKCYEIWKFILFSEIYLNGNRKWKRINGTTGRIGPKTSQPAHDPKPDTVHGTQAYGVGAMLYAWSPRSGRPRWHGVTPHVSKPHDYVNHMFMRL